MEKSHIIDAFLKSFVAPVVREAVRDEIKNHFHFNEDQSPDNEFLNAKDSANFIGDALQTFYGRTSRGEINTYGPPGRIFCKKSELIAFKEKKRTKSTEAISHEVDDFLAKKGRKRYKK